MIVLPRSVALVLDLDDTLYPEREFQRSGFRAIAEHVAPADYEAILEQMLLLGGQGGDPLGFAAEFGSLSKSDLIELYRSHLPTISLYPDAASFLGKVTSVGAQFAIVTDGRSVTQRNKVRALGLEDVCVQLVISEEFGVGKPDPRVFQRAGESLSGNPRVYVADNPAKDFITPNRLGWMTVMLKDRGFNVHPQVVPPGPEYQAGHAIASFDELDLR